MQQNSDRLTLFERTWLIVFLVVITGATVWFSVTGTTWSDWKSFGLNWIVSPLSAITGVLCVVLSAKGKLSNWLWGLVNSVTYGMVAWVSGYYGDWIINWFFFIPTQIMVFFVWRTNLDNRTTIVRMKSLRWHSFWLVATAIAATVLFALFLQQVDNFFTESMKRSSAFYGNITAVTGIGFLGPLMDSSTVIMQVFAQILMILMYAEQWPFWIATNVVTIAIWGTVVATDPTSYSYSIPTLLMWIAFLVNSTYGAFNWYSRSKAKL